MKLLVAKASKEKEIEELVETISSKEFNSFMDKWFNIYDHYYDKIESNDIMISKLDDISKLFIDQYADMTLNDDKIKAYLSYYDNLCYDLIKPLCGNLTHYL